MRFELGYWEQLKALCAETEAYGTNWLMLAEGHLTRGRFGAMLRPDRDAAAPGKLTVIAMPENLIAEN